jgi:hypothetical protein
MFKKLSIKVLLIALVLLATILIIIRVTENKDRTFRSKVLEFNVENITAIDVFDPVKQLFIRIERNPDDTWQVRSEDIVYSGDRDAVLNVLHMMNDMKTERIAATKREKWDAYKVSDSTGIKVLLYEGDKDIADLYVGKFSYKTDDPTKNLHQQGRTKMTSYVRVANENNVYAINGIIRMNFTSGVKFFRNKELASKDFADLSKVSFTLPEDSFILEKSGNRWYIDGQVTDSAKTEKYLRTLSRLRNSHFIDTVDLSAEMPVYNIIVEGGSFDPVALNAYPADTVVQYYITSSINPGTVFDGSKTKLFEKTFVGRSKFVISD